MIKTSKQVALQRLQKVMNVPHQANMDAGTMAFELPGFSFGDFTRTGKLGLWNIQKLVEASRATPLPFSETIQISKERMGMVFISRGNFTRNMYASASMNDPIAIKRHISFIGSTSMGNQADITSKSSGEYLGSIETVSVTADVATRKPVPLPEHYAKFRGKYPSQTQRATFQDRPLGTGGTHVYQSKVAASDMDNQDHATQSCYIKHCFDAAFDAGQKGFLKNLSRDICEYDVQSFVSRHSGEAYAGDVMSVHVWEDPKCVLTLHFEIFFNEEAIFRSTVKLFPLDTSKL